MGELLSVIGILIIFLVCVSVCTTNTNSHIQGRRVGADWTERREILIFSLPFLLSSGKKPTQRQKGNHRCNKKKKEKKKHVQFALQTQPHTSIQMRCGFSAGFPVLCSIWTVYYSAILTQRWFVCLIGRKDVNESDRRSVVMFSRCP